MLEQLEQQSVQNHGIGNIRHMEFIEADQAVALGNTARHLVQRVLLAPNRIKFTMYATHELMKMHTRLALYRHRQIKRSEEHTSELQSLMRISYAVFCLKKQTHQNT